MDPSTNRHTSLVKISHDYTDDAQTVMSPGVTIDNPIYNNDIHTYATPSVPNGKHTSVINVTARDSNTSASGNHLGLEYDTFDLAAAAAAGGEPLNDVTVTYSSAFANPNDVIIMQCVNGEGGITSTNINSKTGPIKTVSDKIDSIHNGHMTIAQKSLGKTKDCKADRKLSSQSGYDTEIEVLASALTGNGELMTTTLLTKPNDYVELSIFSCLLNIVTGVIALNFAIKSRDAWRTGDIQGARLNGYGAMFWSLAGVVIFIVIIAVVVWFYGP